MSAIPLTFTPANILVRLFGWKATVFHGDPAVWSRYRWLAKHLNPGPLKTLDAGCGSGAFTMFAASIGNDAIGYSYDNINNRKATERAWLANNPARFHTVDLRDCEPVPQFDQVICLECIEHILDDLSLVRTLSGMLKPGGRLLLTTPYKNHIPYFEEWKMQTTKEDGGHVRFGYTHQEIRELFNAAGLNVTVEDFCVGFITIQLANLYLILGKMDPHLAWALTFPLRILQPLDRLVTNLFRYPYLSIGVVGTKSM